MLTTLFQNLKIKQGTTALTKQTTNKRWKITARIDTALCIGDSGSSETGADKATVKTTDGKLYIPASTLKGIWRHATETIASSQGHYVCNSPLPQNMCPRPEEELQDQITELFQNDHCVICQIFGSPQLKSRIVINDLKSDIDLGIETTINRSGVTINRDRRVAEDQRLYFTETSTPNAGFEFSGDISLSSIISDEQIELLTAGLNYIHAIGSGKTRGLGWITIAAESQSPETGTQSSETEPLETSDDFTELSLQVTLQSPIITGGRKPSGQAVEALNYIRGGLIRGAVANELLADFGDSKPDADFQKLFTEDDAAIYRNCTPATKILPATATSCKDSPGFIADGKHGVFDTLLERIVAEEENCMYQPNCPKCRGRLESQSGFYDNATGSPKERHLNTRLLTRVAINRQRKVAEEGLLYHLTAIDPVIVNSGKTNLQNEEESKPVILHGSVRVPSAFVEKVAQTLEQKVMRLGGGSSRGLGRVSIAVKDKSKTELLKERIDNFNDALSEVWQAYACLPNISIGQCDGSYFTVNLLSETILTAEDGWQRTMVLTAQMLQDIAACDAELTFVRSFASYGYAGGWNAAWGLPKETELITNIGSVFVFHTPDIDAWLPALQNLENSGIGNRREEGYGQVTICAPFHLHTRDTLTKNKENIE